MSKMSDLRKDAKQHLANAQKHRRRSADRITDPWVGIMHNNIQAVTEALLSISYELAELREEGVGGGR